MVCDIFDPQAGAKGVGITWGVEANLKSPDRGTPIKKSSLLISRVE